MRHELPTQKKLCRRRASGLELLSWRAKNPARRHELAGGRTAAVDLVDADTSEASLSLRLDTAPQGGL